jgi:adenylate cyclase
MGVASLLLGRDQDAIEFLQRSLALNPESGATRSIFRWLAAAYARTGQMPEARQFMAKADQLLPYDTVRGYAPGDLASPVFLDQVRRLQDALRLAGLRDHADEDADFGVAPDRALHGELAGHTPKNAPHVTTIRTPDLVRFLAGMRPVVIDTVTNSWGRSIPGAVGLEFAGLGGSLVDAAQSRLRVKLSALTAGDLGRPIVAVGWNSEHFDGLNLALRLAALGYTQVYWYRGGREAWEVNEEPETDLALDDW